MCCKPWCSLQFLVARALAILITVGRVAAPTKFRGQEEPLISKAGEALEVEVSGVHSTKYRLKPALLHTLRGRKEVYKRKVTVHAGGDNSCLRAKHRDQL